MGIWSPWVNPLFLTGLGNSQPPVGPPGSGGAQVKFFEPFYILNPPVGLQVLSDPGIEPVVIGFTSTYPNLGTNVVGFYALHEPPPSPLNPGLGEAQIDFFDVFYELSPPISFAVVTEPDENIVVIGFTTEYPNQGSDVVGFHAVYEE